MKCNWCRAQKRNDLDFATTSDLAQHKYLVHDAVLSRVRNNRRPAADEDILTLATKGLTFKQIGQQLGMAANAVAYRLAKIKIQELWPSQ